MRGLPPIPGERDLAPMSKWEWCAFGCCIGFAVGVIAAIWALRHGVPAVTGPMVQPGVYTPVHPEEKP